MTNEAPKKLLKKTLPDDEKKTPISIRVNKKQREKLEKISTKLRYKNVSEYIRSVAISRDDPTNSIRYKALSDVSRALNLLKYLKTKHQKNEEIISKLDQLNSQIYELRKLLK